MSEEKWKPESEKRPDPSDLTPLIARLPKERLPLLQRIYCWLWYGFWIALAIVIISWMVLIWWAILKLLL